MPTKEIQGAVTVIDDNIQYTGILRVNSGAAAAGFSLSDPTDATKKLIFDLSGLATNTTNTFAPAAGGTEVTVDGVQTLTNKKLDDTTTTFIDTAAPTKVARFECGSITAGQTRVVTVPDSSDTLAYLSGSTLVSTILTAPTINAATLTGAISGGTFSSSTLTAPTINGATLTGAISGGTVAPTVLTVPASTALTTPALTAPTVATSLLITSTTGALGIPAMTETQRDALTPAPGWIVYNTTTNKLNVRAAAAWEVIVSA